MASYFWVGGAGTWDSTTTTNWSLTSGGAGSAGVPLAADTATFDSSSGTGAVSIAASATCLTCTFGGSGITATLTANNLGAFCFNLNINAGTFNCSTFNITISNTLAQLGGVFTCNGGTITAGGFASTGSSVRTFTLNASTLNITGSSTITLSGSNLTFNAGTSQINCLHTGVNIVGGGYTFYNLSMTHTAEANIAFTGAITFNNLSFASKSSVGFNTVSFSANLTVNGTLTVSAPTTLGTSRYFFQSSTIGTTRTITAAAVSLTDVDFQDITGAGAATWSGTRLGDVGGNTGITFPAAKTVYWNLAGSQNYSAIGWATTSTGTPAAANFPLAQDTAKFTNTAPVTGTVTLNILYNIGTLDFSARSNALTFSTGSLAPYIYGDITLSSALILTSTGIITFAGRNKTQTIISNGGTFSQPITQTTAYDTNVELGGAFLSTNTITVPRGTFNTKNYSLSAASLLTSATGYKRDILLGSSTVTLTLGTPINFGNSAVKDYLLNFDAGTSTINLNNSNSVTWYCGAFTQYNIVNVTFSADCNIMGNANINQLTISPTHTVGIANVLILSSVTIGTLVCSGLTAIKRLKFHTNSGAYYAISKLNIGTWVSPNDIDFSNIVIGGAVGTLSGTRLGNLGGCTGITFSTPKTVYWNLSGTQNMSAIGWAPTSGGTPDVNNLPLPQDIAIIDNSSGITTLTNDVIFNYGTLDMSARTNALTLNNNTVILIVCGSLKFGTGVTLVSPAGITLAPVGDQFFLSSGLTMNTGLIIAGATLTSGIKLLDSFTQATGKLFAPSAGYFDADIYNVSVNCIYNASQVSYIKMGSGTWTFSAGGIGLYINISWPATVYKGTSNVIINDNAVGATRAWTGANVFNDVTIIGSTTGCVLTINGINTFKSLNSTRAVASTIVMTGTTQNIGTWNVKGTAGNLVTLTGGTINLVGGRSTGIDYLSCTNVTSSSSLGEFYVGTNSVNTSGNTGTIFTVEPTARTLYWRGGTGTWDATTTTNWSLTSGDTVGGAAPPTSVDSVVFNSASNATAYTVTSTATILRCKDLTFSAPASGNVTWTGTAPVAIQNSFTLPATGLTISFTGILNCTGTGAGKTFITNGTTLVNVNINGLGAIWGLGSNLALTGSITVINGTFNTNNYSITCGAFLSNFTSERTINLGSSTISVVGSSAFNSTGINLNFNAGTSQINFSSSGPIITGAGVTFYNVGCTSTQAVTTTISGANTYNNLSFASRAIAGIVNISITDNQTVNGTLTVPASTVLGGTRYFIQSNILGTTRTITAAAVSLTDVDFRDITGNGTATWTGTRLGNCGGNTGITFPTAKTVYWNLVGTPNFSDIGWATTSTGTPATTNFPLAQDTAVFTDVTGTGVLVTSAYNLGTITFADPSNPRTAAFSFAVTAAPSFYGDVTLSSDIAWSSGGICTYVGRNKTQTITSAGRTFTGGYTQTTIGGGVVFADAFTTLGNVVVTNGSLSTNYNITSLSLSSNNSNTRSITLGAMVLSLTSTGLIWNTATTTGLTFNAGTSKIALTNTTTTVRSFSGGGLTFYDLEIGGATGTSTFTISDSNTFNTISSLKTVAHTIAFAASTVTKVADWTVKGSAGNEVTLSGSPHYLVKTGGGTISSSYLSLSNSNASPINTWYTSSTNLINTTNTGWIIYPVPKPAFFLMF